MSEDQQRRGLSRILAMEPLPRYPEKLNEISPEMLKYIRDLHTYLRRLFTRFRGEIINNTIEDEAPNHVGMLPHGGATSQGADQTLSLTTQDQFEKFTDFTRKEPLYEVEVDLSTGEVIPQESGIYLVNGSFSASSDQANADIIAQVHDGDGNAFDNLLSEVENPNANTPVTFSVSGLIKIEAGTKLSIHMKCTSHAGVTLTMESATLSIVRLMSVPDEDFEETFDICDPDVDNTTDSYTVNTNLTIYNSSGGSCIETDCSGDYSFTVSRTSGLEWYGELNCNGNHIDLTITHETDDPCRWKAVVGAYESLTARKEVVLNKPSGADPAGSYGSGAKGDCNNGEIRLEVNSLVLS